MSTTPLCTGAEGEGDANLGVESGCRPGLVEVVEVPPADVPPVAEAPPEPLLAEPPAADEPVVPVLVVVELAGALAVVELEPPDPQPAIASSATHAIATANGDLFTGAS
jgi:hypothetical protein